ncbi:hypothetical protein E4U22_002310, partial [Claviceps purpurea]
MNRVLFTVAVFDAPPISVSCFRVPSALTPPRLCELGIAKLTLGCRCRRKPSQLHPAWLVAWSMRIRLKDFRTCLNALPDLDA